MLVRFTDLQFTMAMIWTTVVLIGVAVVWDQRELSMKERWVISTITVICHSIVIFYLIPIWF